MFSKNRERLLEVPGALSILLVSEFVHAAKRFLFHCRVQVSQPRRPIIRLGSSKLWAGA